MYVASWMENYHPVGLEMVDMDGHGSHVGCESSGCVLGSSLELKSLMRSVLSIGFRTFSHTHLFIKTLFGSCSMHLHAAKAWLHWAEPQRDSSFFSGSVHRESHALWIPRKAPAEKGTPQAPLI